MSEINKIDRFQDKEILSQKAFRTPQEKKRLSYARDCRNCYGESDKGSRTTIKRHKASSNRRLRRAVDRALQIETINNASAESGLAQATIRKYTRKKWRKYADKPLGEIIKGKVEERGKPFNAKIKRRIKASYTYREK
ncbi:MAG: hypothetical protein M3525_05480 [Acidobacteriota bacterium]|nr:hypothetical protein [Acidobacteriota bacterium]